MKEFVVYTEDKNINAPYYLKENGDYSHDIKDAKKYIANNWITFVLTVLQLLLQTIGTNLKYKKL